MARESSGLSADMMARETSGLSAAMMAQESNGLSAEIMAHESSGLSADMKARETSGLSAEMMARESSGLTAASAKINDACESSGSIVYQQQVRDEYTGSFAGYSGISAGYSDTARNNMIPNRYSFDALHNIKTTGKTFFKV